MEAAAFKRSMSKKQKKRGVSSALAEFSQAVTLWSGSSWAFIAALATIVIWATTGPIFHYSDTWQLVINTGTTIITFLMVFLIQRAQNKESLAVQVKLNEIIAAIEGASNRLIDIEDLSEEEVKKLHKQYEHLGKLLKSERDPKESRSIEDETSQSPKKKKTRVS
jgi:low affinity Fe/Cu permease